MARRRSNVTSRFSKMRGLDPVERDLLVRIGNLIDGAINNRAPGNPFEPRRNKTDRRLRTPTNVLIKTGIKSVKLVWDAIDSSVLLRYEIEITNVDTGESFTQTSFTNSLTFKGRAGTYKALIRAVGRNNKTSPVKEVSFGIAGDVMYIEGAKNEVEELGTLVSDDIALLKDYKIFAWGSCVLDKFAAGASNNDLVFELYKGPKGGGIDKATLVEQIVMYPTTTTGTNFDDSALGGLITRPPASRSATFECSQSVMFSPISVDDTDNGTTQTFFLKAINREVEDDIVSLSLVLWAGSEGISSKVPGDPFTPEPDFVFPWKKSIWLIENPGVLPAAEDANWLHGEIVQNVRMLANQWTIGLWVRPYKLGDTSGDAASSGVIFERTGLNAFLNYNSVRVNHVDIAGSNHRMDVLVGDFSGNTSTWRKTSPLTNGTFKTSNIWPNGQNSNSDGFNGGWHFLVLVFNGSPSASTSVLDVYQNASKLTPDTEAKGIVQDTTIEQAWVLNVNWNSISTVGVYDGPTVNPSNLQTFGAFYYAMGAWNVALTSTEIAYLYNGDAGAEINWRENGSSSFGTYSSANNLIHYWQFAAVTSDIQYVARDTGFHPFGGDINLTGQVGGVNSYDNRFSFDYEYIGQTGNIVDDYPGFPYPF